MNYLFIIVFIYIGIILFLNIYYPELRWNWNLIDTDNIKFPKEFIWGTATASHQVEGGLALVLNYKMTE